jgi:hypothetical protein
VQVEYVTRALMAPLIDKRASIIEIKQSAEMQFVNKVHSELQGSVFSAGCTNWYINEFGRNAASWPGLASAFWRHAYFPKFHHYNMAPASKFWVLNTIKRWILTFSHGKTRLAVLGALLALLSKKEDVVYKVILAAQDLKGRAF